MSEVLPAPSETTVEDTKPKLKKPRPYKVVLVNDDYTPMDFVVYVLQKYFDMNEHRAVLIMFDVHRSGSGVCGLYPREVAEMKVRDVLDCAKYHSHPLQCTMEPE